MTKPKRLVLVADDDSMILELASDILSLEYEVIKAVDGQDAWEKALASRPELVVTDLMMPRMHGYELCERLKGPGGVKGIRIVVASSKPFSTDKTQAEASGADAYIVKPYSPSTLIETVRGLLAEKNPETAAPDAIAAGPASPPHAAAGSAVSRPPAPGQAGVVEPSQVPSHMTLEPLPVSVRFWGTRGSCPVSGPGVVRYGGNTACTEVRIGDLLLIIDCGTGLRDLGTSIVREFRDRPITGHIFVGHTHWDHIQGFPFFAPLYNPRNSFNLYSVHGAGGSLESVFSGSMASDYFPIPLLSLAGKVRFIEMSGPVDLGAASVSFCHLNHPGICIGFRIEAQGRIVTYLSDHETFARLNGKNSLSLRQDKTITDFAKGSDLLIQEAQYTDEEYASRRGWGHSTFADAVRCAAEAGAKRLAVFHHDPEHTDDIMDAHVEYCRALAREAGVGTDCFAARDGLRIDL